MDLGTLHIEFVHIGPLNCGYVFQARDLFASVEDSLFPKDMVVAENLKRTLKPSKENGGWGDKRDHELCINNSRVPDLAAYDFDLHNPAGMNSIYANVSRSVIVPL